ncbi:hypothetical protein ACFZBU_20910 [Embleya sp. NPDC008237]|uniref:hypothetical protein n=1 Tax=unclassified Embleya TaxID=2699296 RepID=UPI0036E5FF26
MSDRPVITTAFQGRTIQLPGTLADIRAALPEDRRAAFDDEINHAPLRQIAAIAVHWASPPELNAQVEADAARVRSGDMSGLTNADGTPFTP